MLRMDMAVPVEGSQSQFFLVTGSQLVETTPGTWHYQLSTDLFNGTITNRQGKVQRLRPAFAPPGQALPATEVLARLARKLGATFEYPTAKVVFQEMKAGVPAFAQAEWGAEALTVQLRFAGSRG